MQAEAAAEQSSIIKFNILERSDGMMMANENVGEAGNGMPEFLGDVDAGNMIVSLAGSRRQLPDQDEQMDEEDDYRYCQGEDDEDDAQQDRDDNGEGYHAQNDLTASLRAVQQQDDDDDAYRDMSSSEANTRYNCQQVEDEPYHRAAYDDWQKHKELQQDEEEEQLAGHDIEIREEVYDFDDFSFEELWK